MKEALENRLAQLREERAAGERVLAELQSREAELRQTLLRINGAIQVLEEVLQSERGGAAAPGEG
jgi:uncharacterized coiled-coil protein SlyX